MAWSKWEILKLIDLVEAIVNVQSNKACAWHIKWDRFWKPISFDQKFGRRLHQTTRRKPAEVSLLSFYFASSWETSDSREALSMLEGPIKKISRKMKDCLEILSKNDPSDIASSGWYLSLKSRLLIRRALKFMRSTCGKSNSSPSTWNTSYFVP